MSKNNQDSLILDMQHTKMQMAKQDFAMAHEAEIQVSNILTITWLAFFVACFVGIGFVVSGISVALGSLIAVSCGLGGLLFAVVSKVYSTLLYAEKQRFLDERKKIIEAEIREIQNEGTN